MSIRGYMREMIVGLRKRLRGVGMRDVGLLLLLVMFMVGAVLLGALVRSNRQTVATRATDGALEVLKGGVSFTIASYNADGYCTNEGKQTLENKGEPNEYWRGCPAGVPRISWREAMRQYIQSGGKHWDIVGLQEAGYPTDPKSDTAHFVQFMKEDYQRDYQCVAGPKSTNWKGNVICSIYPIRRDSVLAMERDRSFADCAVVETPAGEIVFCNGHPPYQAPVETFNRMQSWILNQVIPSYIPAQLSPLTHEAYRKSLLARMILVGDMNIEQSKIVGIFQTTCSGVGDQSGIDHIMYPDMKRSELGGATGPFSTSYLVPSVNGCKTMVERWPTDHGGPVVATFTSKGLEISQDGIARAAADVTVETPVASAPAEIKVMTFNVGSPSKAGYDDRYGRAKTIAEFARKESIAIIGLQEMNYYPEQNLVDGEIYKKVFTDIGYDAHVVQVKEQKHEANLIVSRFPFVEGTYREYLVGGGRNRIIQRVAVQTPGGRLWVVNVHTNVARSCKETEEILKVFLENPEYKTPEGEPAVLLGDFNLPLLSDGSVEGCQFYNLLDKYLLSYQVVCEDPARCTNVQQVDAGGKRIRFIDWIISPKTSNTRILRVWENGEIKQVGDGHPVILGEITHPSFSSPRLTPTPQATIVPATPAEAEIIPTYLQGITPSPNQQLRW